MRQQAAAADSREQIEALVRDTESVKVKVHADVDMLDDFDDNVDLVNNDDLKSIQKQIVRSIVGSFFPQYNIDATKYHVPLREGQVLDGTGEIELNFQAELLANVQKIVTHIIAPMQQTVNHGGLVSKLELNTVRVLEKIISKSIENVRNWGTNKVNA